MWLSPVTLSKGMAAPSTLSPPALSQEPFWLQTHPAPSADLTPAALRVEPKPCPGLPALQAASPASLCASHGSPLPALCTILEDTSCVPASVPALGFLCLQSPCLVSPPILPIQQEADSLKPGHRLRAAPGAGDVQTTPPASASLSSDRKGMATSSPTLLGEDALEQADLLNVPGVFSPPQGPGELDMDPLWPPHRRERGGGGLPPVGVKFECRRFRYLGIQVSCMMATEKRSQQALPWAAHHQRGRFQRGTI